MRDRVDLLLARAGRRVRLVRRVSTFAGLLASGKYRVLDAARIARRTR